MARLPKVGRATLAPTATTEIVRSFSYKLNVGNYESRDFFCSQKAECSIEDAEDISGRLYQFCKSQVMRAVNDYMAVQASRDTRKAG